MKSKKLPGIINDHLILSFTPFWVSRTLNNIVVAIFVCFLSLLSHYGFHTFTCCTSAVPAALVFVLLIVFVLAMLIVEATFVFVVATTFAKSLSLIHI